MNKIKERIIFWFFLIILVAFEIYSIKINNTYKWDGLFLLGLLLLTFYFRKKLNLCESHFIALGIFLVLHNMGVFGAYYNYYFGIEFDTYVHSYAGIVMTLISYRMYDSIICYKNKKLKYFIIIMFILGISAFHEILEYAGGVILGEGLGFLKSGSGDIEMWDTQTDMRNNLFGSIFVLFIYWIKSKWINKKFKN